MSRDRAPRIKKTGIQGAAVPILPGQGPVSWPGKMISPDGSRVASRSWDAARDPSRAVWRFEGAGKAPSQGLGSLFVFEVARLVENGAGLLGVVAHHQHGTRGMSDDLGRVRAQEIVLQFEAMCGHDDEVRIYFFSHA